MPGELSALGEWVAGAHVAKLTAGERGALDQAMRASLLCVLLGVERESWSWPFNSRSGSRAGRLLGGLYESLDGIGELATLAGAADLDPMDPGPSHTVLPATLAACVLGGSDELIASSVLSGVEAAWRLRRAVTGARPGVGFHSPGVYGTVAAAVAGARALDLNGDGCTRAMAIALTRASGLAINSAASRIGITHFGWGAAHGLEAALLAAEDWSASTDVEKALASLFGSSTIDAAAIMQDTGAAVAALVFKRYPCNIYLNVLVSLLEQIDARPLDRIEVAMPWVPHLDCAAPADVRAARNSAQAVAAIAGAGPVSYAAFSGPPGRWMPSSAVRTLLPHVHIAMDRAAPTRLNEAMVGLVAWRDGKRVLQAERPVRDLKGWGVEHAQTLLGPGRDEPLAALYAGPLLGAYSYVAQRRSDLRRQRTN